MSSTNLTWQEAKDRAALIGVDRYSIILDLTDGHGLPGEKIFTSKTTVWFHTRDGVSEGDLEEGTFLDLRASRVTSVQLNGTDVTTDAIRYSDNQYDEEAGIQLRNLEPGDNRVTVCAECRYSTSGEGLHRFVDPSDNAVYLYTQFETADAKRVFACFDQPDLKATYRVQVITPDSWRLITNGPVSTTVTSPRAGILTTDGDNPQTTVAIHEAEVDYPLSTYLIAFMAGPYTEATDVWRGTITPHPETSDKSTETSDESASQEVEIPLGLYCRRALAEHLDSEELFKETKQGFDFYAKHFGIPYPFKKYDQVFCPEYNMGAMENAGAVTIREDYVFRSATTRYLYERRNDTILHEMAHMWFGDLVTMKWWNDLWLNESFATWSSAQAQTEVSEFTTAWVTFAHVEKAWAYAQDQMSSTHPISTDASDIETVDQNFDGITYAKGASVLKQLAAYVGLDEFFAGVRLHFQRHQYDNATFNDLLDALEESSGRDLSQWADQWLKTTGVNTLSVDAQAKDGAYTSVAVKQSGAQPGEGEHRDHRIGVGVYSLQDGDVVRTANTELDIHGESTDVPELVGTPVGDLILPNDGDLTYALIDLDDASNEFVLNHLPAIKDPMARALCWSAEWERLRVGRLRARDFIALVERGLPHETETAVVQQLVRQVVSAARNYANPTWLADEGWDAVAHALVSTARAAAPGSDTQLAAVKELPNVEPTAETVAIARAIVDGTPESVELDGLSIDTDMTWLAIKMLAASSGSHGVSEDEVTKLIDETSANDRSSLGEQAAIAARALLPTTDNKSRVWDDIMGEDASTLSNRQLLSNVAGFRTAGSDELLAGYRDRYFDEALGVWENLNGEMALRVLAGMYPSWDTSDEAIARAEKLVANEELPAGFRRLIAEGKDNQRRFAAAREHDRS